MRALLVLCCCVISLSAQAERFTAKVIAVMDGDTVMVLRGNQKIKIRMANIDAPEKDQTFGAQSRDSLSQMVDKKTVQVDSQAIDSYGRMVGMLSLDGLDINKEQLRRGMAWENSHYHADQHYLSLQATAKQQRLGLWAQANPQAPWEWRKLHPSSAPGGQATPKNSTDGSALQCGNKRRCTQMTSCAEAQFYFNHCRVKTLDSNHDGVPCESLCNSKQ